MRINYLQFGEKGLPLIFLHGWQQDGRCFLPLVNFLYQDYRLFFLDLPGFGQSEKPSEIFNSLDYAKVLTDWLKKKKFKKIVLIGHSFGGKIAAIIASQNLSLVSKLILISSSGLPSSNRLVLLKKILPESLLKKIPSSFKKLFASQDFKNAGELLPLFKKIVEEDVRPIFAKLNLPTLIIWGKEDKELPAKNGKIIKHLIKKSELFLVKGDHFPFWQNPQKIAGLIKDFIEK